MTSGDVCWTQPLMNYFISDCLYHKSSPYYNPSHANKWHCVCVSGCVYMCVRESVREEEREGMNTRVYKIMQAVIYI